MRIVSKIGKPTTVKLEKRELRILQEAKGICKVIVTSGVAGLSTEGKVLSERLDEFLAAIDHHTAPAKAAETK